MSKLESVAVVIVLIVVAVAGRVLPHMANFAPVTAAALFTGAYMTRRYSLLSLLAILLLSDYLLLYFNPFGSTSFDRFYAPWDLWHRTLPYVYASFGISALDLKSYFMGREGIEHWSETLKAHARERYGVALDQWRPPRVVVSR